MKFKIIDFDKDIMFNSLTALISSDGGDGTAIIICKDYIKIAHLFDEWRKNRDHWKDFVMTNEEYDNVLYILFNDKQNENIIFTPEYMNYSGSDFVFEI